MALSDQEQIRLLNIDGSRIDSKALAIDLNCIIGGGQLSVSTALHETASSLNAKVNLAAEKITADSLNKFLLLPENYFSGEIQRLALVGTGMIDSPRTWSGTMSLQVSDAHVPPMNFERGAIEVSAGEGRATLRAADIVQDKNELHLRGTMELPSVIEDFGRTPATLEIAGAAPDLQRLTRGIPAQLTGSAQFTGKIDIVNAKIEATLGVTAESIGFSNGTIEKLSSTLRASKNVAHADTKRPWFADLRTAMEFNLAGIHYRDHIIDSIEGSLNGTDDVLGLDRLNLRRNQNELNVRGRYKLPEEWQSFLATCGFGFQAQRAGAWRLLGRRFSEQVERAIANGRANRMEAADCQRPGFDFRIESENEGSGFSGTEHAMFNLK